MEKIIKKSIGGGYPNGEIETNNDGTWYTESKNITNVKHQYELLCDPLFWQALFRNKTEALIPRQKFFSILFGDEGGNEGWDEAVKYLESMINL